MFSGLGGPESVGLTETDRPEPGLGDLLVKVEAAGLNRADLLQRDGYYPPPEGVTPVPGLEIAGVVAAVGARVHRFREGDRVCGLVAGGGQADYCVLPERQALPMPAHWSFVRGAAIPEAFMAADHMMVTLGGLRSGESVLIHAGSSGVGSAAIQVANMLQCDIFTTAGSPAKINKCRALGARICIPYKEEDFAEVVLAQTEGRGVDLVVDFIGAAYLKRNLRVLRTGGRLVVVGLLGGVKAEINLATLLAKRLNVLGGTLRALPSDEKQALVDRFRARWWPLFLDDKLREVVDRTFPVEEVRSAHEVMASGTHFGKIVLTF